jgi:hypothetical protein
MACEYHIAAVGGSDDDEVSVDLVDILNTLGAQDWVLKAAIALQESDTLLLILSRTRHRPVRLERSREERNRAAGAVVSGLVLFVMAHHAEHRHSPTGQAGLRSADRRLCVGRDQAALVAR